MQFIVLFRCRLLAFAALASLLSTSFPQSDPRGNSCGISVGAVKRFDERSLALRLRQLSDQLTGLKLVDSSALSNRIGGVNGADTRGASSLVKISTPNMPFENGAKKGFTGTLPGDAGQIPSVPEGDAKAPTPALSAVDLLSDQLALQYQVINLQLLLEDALSDRYLFTSGTAAPRSNTVLGFQVSIDPPRGFDNAVAEVQITIRRPKSKGLSLVSLYPKETTYNVATIRRRSDAFQLGGVLDFLGIGIGGGNASESYYLVKDTDTVALVRESTPEAISFGWQFRPVLNEKAVRPGIRQVFAQIALDDDPGVNWDGLVEAKTIWRRYDRNKRQAGDVIAGSEHMAQPLNVLLIPTTEPTGLQSRATDNGGGKITIDVTGDNLIDDGTQIFVGSKELTADDGGLFFRSTHSLSFTVDAVDLFRKDVYVLGRSGEKHRLEIPLPSVSGTWKRPVNDSPVLKDQGAIVALKTDGTAELTASVVVPPDEVYKHPVLMFGDTLYGTPSNPITLEFVDGVLTLQTDVPREKVASVRACFVRFGYWGSSGLPLDLPIHIVTESPMTINEITLQSSAPTQRTYLITGGSIPESVEVLVGGSWRKSGDGGGFRHLSNRVLVLVLSNQELSSVKKLVFRGGNRGPDTLATIDVPASQATVTNPALDSVTIDLEPTMAGSTAVTGVGTSLDLVRGAAISGTPIKIVRDDDNFRFRLIDVAKFLDKEGTIDVDFYLATKKQTVKLRVMPKPEAQAPPKTGSGTGI